MLRIGVPERSVRYRTAAASQHLGTIISYTKLGLFHKKHQYWLCTNTSQLPLGNSTNQHTEKYSSQKCNTHSLLLYISLPKRHDGRFKKRNANTKSQKLKQRKVI
jgi:hypothetical protein